MSTNKQIRILFVCMGNICRSPTAEAVLRRIAAEEAAELRIEVASAGTHDYHVGDPPDPRAQAAARRRGIDMSRLRARQLAAADFDAFDYLLVMDERNLEDARALAPQRFRARLGLLLDYAPELEQREVPDPYYGGAAGFEEVLDLLEAAARGLLSELRAPRSSL
ncbi:MAG TPA: low molecular weight protein-tyrosine-phosphatase [Steroidobacteraceae bacterium]|nr:low molecular weight protein-tyrosine-phosphatase [Steroidobacteraceae bacterium]